MGTDMELWDAYDADRNRIAGVALVRGESIPAGMFHLVCAVLVRHTDGTYLIMQRDFHKHLGGMWEATAGGSALQGESPADCAVRELFEETGVAAVLSSVGRETSAERQTHYEHFLGITGIEKDHVVLQAGETIGCRWVTADELISMRAALATQRMLQYVDCAEKRA